MPQAPDVVAEQPLRHLCRWLRPRHDRRLRPGRSELRSRGRRRDRQRQRRRGLRRPRQPDRIRLRRKQCHAAGDRGHSRPRSGSDEAPSIEQNHVRMAGGTGIESRFETGHVTGNEIEGGSIGIWTKVGEGGGLIASNTVEAATEYGILVESPDNEVRANEVIGSGGAGISVITPLGGVAMTGNLIGGSTAEKENTDPKQRRPGDRNPRRGAANRGAGPKSPATTAAATPGSSSTWSTARTKGSPAGLLLGGARQRRAGSAEPGAKVRVFRKASAEAGELQSFLGEAKADGSGNWKVTYRARFPGETLVAATQTNANGATSELATAAVRRPTRAAAAVADNGGGSGSHPRHAPPRRSRSPRVRRRSRQAPPPSSSSGRTRPARASNASSTRASSRSAARRRPTRS